MNYIQRGIILSSLSALLFCASILNAQIPGQDNNSSSSQVSNLDDRSFIIKALAQIAMKLAESESKEREEINAQIKAEQDAEAELNKVREAKDRAGAELLAKNQDVKTAEKELADIMTGGGGREEAALAVRQARYESSKAKSTVDLLAKVEEVANNKLALAKASRENAQQANTIQANLRAHQKAELDRLSTQWQNRQTEVNLVALTDKITAIACEQDIMVNPFWKTTPTLGANIYYQSIGERRRGATPNPINNPTQTQQPICLGKYYVWAERGGKATSNKDKTFTIYLGVTEIIVVEDR